MRYKIDGNWKFFYGDLSPRSETEGWGGAKARAYSFGAASESLDDSRWRTVDLPHDFVMEGEYTQKSAADREMQQIPEMESMDSRHFAGGSLEGGIGWYRKHFSAPAGWEGKRIYLYFDGIFRDSTFYLNEYFLGRQESGYVSFFFDITDFVNFGGENLLAVRVAATGREGWWYEGGGIYRHVWLEVKEPVHLAPWGVYVRPQVDPLTGTADVRIRAEVNNFFLTEQTVTVSAVLSDAEGRPVAHFDRELTADAWETTVCELSAGIDGVRLWSLEDPYLYTLTAAVTVKDAGEAADRAGDVTGLANWPEHAADLADSCRISIGFRHCLFDPDRGFFLNGKHVKLQGVCCHHDHAGVGIAVPDSVQEYRLARLKEMGINAYRTAHYPPAPELLDFCDRMGILVFDETRRMSAAQEDLERLRAMVKRDRNHPSVFLWGIGNEEIFAQDRPEMARATVTMRMAVRKLDDTRPVTSAVVCWNGKERFDHADGYLPVTKELDVMGFNYCQSAWDDYHERMPQQPVIITEASSNSWTRGCYQTAEERGQYYLLDPDNAVKCRSKSKAVKADIAEAQWKACREREYIAGLFIWTGIDYRGEPTPLAWPAVNSQFGVLDACGFRKDNFYYYQSWWGKEPVLHLFPHWNFPGREGKMIAVHCYSNMDEVELFVNGRSCGRKTMERDGYLTWEQVRYEPGVLMAKGYRGGTLCLTERVETTGAPRRILLEPYRDPVKTGETVIIAVRVADEQGRTVPTADEEISFTVEGSGEFLGTGNGNPGSHESDRLPVRRAFHGLCQVLVKSRRTAGQITVRAAAEGLEEAVCRVTVEDIPGV